jgi:aspartate aminotransferase/aminotransferase
VNWIADRTKAFDSSGIREIFNLASKMQDPINLSIGQPDFDIPEPIKEEMIAAIRSGKNGYALTQGMPVLREKLQAALDEQYQHADRQAFVCSGTSGGLTLAMLALVNPGDEVIFFDPFFVMYESLIHLAAGVPVLIDTYPDFQPDLQRVADAITDRTKMIILNSPSNPTGVVLNETTLKSLAELAAKHNIVLLSDEIYSHFVYDQPFVSPAKYNDQTLVIDGFSKTYAMTGHRLGFVHGPKEVIQTMIKLQQYTFVCAPQPAQWAGAVAMDTDISAYVTQYQHKRDLICDGIGDLYELVKPSGAFYVFPKLPWGTGKEFVSKAIENNLLVIPGKIFSHHDTHFRISYAAKDETIKRGIDVLRRIHGG